MRGMKGKCDVFQARACIIDPSPGNTHDSSTRDHELSRRRPARLLSTLSRFKTNSVGGSLQEVEPGASTIKLNGHPGAASMSKRSKPSVLPPPLDNNSEDRGKDNVRNNRHHLHISIDSTNNSTGIRSGSHKSRSKGDAVRRNPDEATGSGSGHRGHRGHRRRASADAGGRSNTVTASAARASSPVQDRGRMGSSESFRGGNKDDEGSGLSNAKKGNAQQRIRHVRSRSASYASGEAVGDARQVPHACFVCWRVKIISLRYRLKGAACGG